MPNAHVQSAIGDWSSGSSVDVSLTVTNGNLLAVAVPFIAGNSSNTVTGVSDGVNTFTEIVRTASTVAGQRVEISLWYAINITGGTRPITASFGASVDDAQIIVHEVSGADTTAPLGVFAAQSQTAPGTGANAVTSGSVVTATNGEYIFGAVVVGFNETLSAGTGFTSGPAATNDGFSEYQIQGTAGSIAATFTAPSGGGTYKTAIATFKAASGGGTSILRQMLAHHG